MELMDVLGAVAVVAAVGAFFGLKARARRASWAYVAEQLGLELVAAPGLGRITGDARLVGQAQGFAVEIRTLARNAGDATADHAQVATRVTLTLGFELGVGLALVEADTVAHLNPADAIQTGDPAFDQTFRVSGYDPGSVARLLTPDVRERLLALKRDLPGAIIGDDAELVWTFEGFLDSALILSAALRALTAVAEALAAAHAPSPNRAPWSP